ncbi:MAG: hypothetical protein LBG92_02300 [Prevotellaceae bacterium]|nr:hypothetical protein [Prevotellaceae bacterium]
MQKIYKYILPAVFTVCAGLISAQNNEVVSVIKKEIDRNMANLKIDKLKPPFFISYNMVDSKIMTVSATLGSVIYSNGYRLRLGAPALMVGDYNRNSSNFGNSAGNIRNVSLENEGVPVSVWFELDNVYKRAAENFEAKLAAIAQQNLEKEDLELPDFESVPSAALILEPAKVNQDRAYWENYAKKTSEVFKKYSEILSSSVEITVRDAMVYTCNTENTEIVMPQPFYQIRIQASGRAGDGEQISRDLYIEHPTFEQIPDLKKAVDTCEFVAKQLVGTLNAPMLKEAYSGPVLFEGQAAPEVVQMLVANLVAARKPVTGNGGNNLEMMKDKKLTARILSLISLSGTETYNGKKLDGYYPIDIEGVAPDKELTLIENGVLKNMLNGRTPTRKFQHSNGHRRFSERDVRSSVKPGNIRLTSKVVSSNMKQKLIDAAKEEDLDYAYIVRGYRGLTEPNSVNVYPYDVYRVYVSDGREELVRGAILQDFNIKSFKRVVGTSEREILYNTYAFGNFVTYVVPDAILFEELEISKNSNITLKTPFIVPQP